MAEASIRLSNISTVKPSTPTAIDAPMFLSNVDLFFCPVQSVERLLFYPTPPPPPDFSSVVRMLKSSLSSALVYFYPLAGRLIIAEDNRPQIHCNDAGVEFVEASTDLAFQDLQKDDFQHTPIFGSLVHSLAHRNQRDDHPLFSVQVTAFGGGGFCIGFALHYVVADGKSIWYFMKSWAECSRGVPISAYPHLDRTLLNSDKLNNGNHNVANYKVCFKDGTLTFEEDGGGRPLGASNKQQFDEQVSREGENLNMVCRTFNLNKETIEGLKVRANANGAAGPCSSLVSVAAHFWRCVIRAREVPPEERVNIGLLADVRNRLNPPLPSNFFGNCVQVTVAKTSAGELLSREVSFAAQLIQKAVNSCTEKNFKAMVNWMESYAGIEDLLKGCSVAVVGTPRHPLYEIDYGWGRAVQVQPASFNGIGQMLVHPGRDGDGSFDISTGLPPHQMEIFCSLFTVDTF